MLIHESLPFREIQLNTQMQAVAASVQLIKAITICNIYASGNHEFTEHMLEALIQQLPDPVLLLGDFNGHNRIWGINDNDARDKMIERVICNNYLNVLNNGAPTRIKDNAESAIDLTIVSPELQMDLQWAVSLSPRDSDHNPILITSSGCRTNEQKQRYRNFKRANWEKYTNHNIWKTIPEDAERRSAAELVEDLDNRLDKVAEAAMPIYATGRFFPKPWWSHGFGKNILTEF